MPLETNAITGKIIGCAIEVHRTLGPGLLEPTYDGAMCVEFDCVGLKYVRQFRIPAVYKNHVLGHYRLDFVVEDTVVVEVKAVERTLPVFAAQVLTYMRVGNLPLGLLINFNVPLVTEGIQRFAM